MSKTREQYNEYAKKIVSVLQNEEFYSLYKNKIEAGASNVKMYKKRLIQDISIDWIETIEDVLPNLDAIVRNPRRFIVQEEDIVDVSLAKSISTESIKHLAQHTNMISKIEKDGSVIPNKILNITKEESFEIYENRFLYTLLLKLKDFVTMRYDKIKKASATQDVLQLEVESRFNLPSKKISYRTEYMAQLSFDEVMQLDPETLTKIERVAKIDRIVTDFLSSSFAKAMRSSAPVRPPITRTNVILKEPNFKKALTLWQFIETYQLTGGFATSDEIEDLPVEGESMANLRDLVTLNSMVFESMYEHEGPEDKKSMEDTDFLDVMRIGEMDFLPDQVIRDPWAQKMEDKLKVDEDENEKELEKEKTDQLEPEDEIKPDEKPEDRKDEEEKKEDIPEEETQAPPKEKEEGDEEGEKEKETETPPKDWEDEEDDDEPNEDKFDKNLFQVKMLYKRPKEDRLRQEEIGRIKDAIDRCLALYRTQKQNEADEELQEKKRRRLAERAEALRRQRSQEMLSRGIGEVLGDTFTSQTAKIVLPKPGEKISPDEVDELEQRIEPTKEHDIKIGDLSKDAKPDIGFDYSELDKLKEQAKKPSVKKDTKAEKLSKRVVVTNDPWALSSTTLNQKYSQASGRVKKFEAVDESQVGVGKNPLKLRSASDILGGTFGQDKVVIKINRKSAKPKVDETKVDEIKTDNKKPDADKKKIDTITETEVTEKTSAVEKPSTVKETKAKQTAVDDKPRTDAKQKTEPKTDDKARVDDNSKTDKPKTTKTSSTSKVEVGTERKAGQNIRISGMHDPWALSSTTINQKYSKPQGKQTNLEAVDEKKVSVGKITVRKKNLSDVLSTDFMGDKAQIKVKPKNTQSSADKTKTKPPTKKDKDEKEDN